MTELESLVNELDSAGFKYGDVFDFRNHTFSCYYGIVHDHADDNEVLYFEIEACKNAETMVEIGSLDPTGLAYRTVEEEKARYATLGYDTYEMNKADFLRDYKLSRIFK